MSGGGIHISASIICGKLGLLSKELADLKLAGVDSIHVDVMDGQFVENLGGGPDLVAAIRESTDLEIHVHMQIERPERFVEMFADAGANVYIFHIESTKQPLRLIGNIARSGMVPGVAVNPATPLQEILAVDVPLVLVMTVEPGFSGQRWIPGSEERVAQVRATRGPSARVGIDGNVDLDHATGGVQAGADLLVCGTSVLFTGDSDYAPRVEQLRVHVGCRPVDPHAVDPTDVQLPRTGAGLDLHQCR